MFEAKTFSNFFLKQKVKLNLRAEFWHTSNLQSKQFEKKKRGFLSALFCIIALKTMFASTTLNCSINFSQ